MLEKNNIKSKKGFTIIEVVLVLAVAGLIFLMVFLALPALQRSQKNTQRKNDMSRLTAAVAEYQSNNKNKVPAGVANIKDAYLGGNFSGPNNDYTSVSVSCSTSTCPAQTLSSGDDKIIWYVNAVCKKDTASTSTNANAVVEPAGKTTVLTRKLAFVVKMDGSNNDDGALYCVNN